MKRYTNIWIICILLCLVITAGCVEHLNHKPDFPVEDISTIHVTFVGCELGADFLTISLHDDNANIELRMKRHDMKRHTTLDFHEAKDVPVQLVENELELVLSRFEGSFRAPNVPEPFPPVPGVPEYIIRIGLKNNTRYRIDQLCGGPICIESDKANGTSFCIARHSIDYFTPLRDLSAKVFELDPTLKAGMFKEFPSLLDSKLTRIDAHNLDGDYFTVFITNGKAELKIGVHDENKSIYQSAKEVPVEQISDELNSFTELFNRGVAAEHVEMPLERSMSSDYDVVIHLADGRHYLISQIINAPIQVDDKTSKPARVMFYLEPYSIDYTQPIQDIGTKAFDLQPPIQEKFFDSR